MHIIGTLIILSSCNSMLQNKGNVRYENTYINNFNNGGVRYDNSFINSNQAFSQTEGVDYDYINYDLFDRFNFGISDSLKNKINGGDKMESDISTLVTALGSALAGLYAVVKTIINIVKKFKKN